MELDLKLILTPTMVKMLLAAVDYTKLYNEHIKELKKASNRNLESKLFVDTFGKIENTHFIVHSRKLRALKLLDPDNWCLTRKGELVVELINLTLNEAGK